MRAADKKWARVSHDWARQCLTPRARAGAAVERQRQRATVTTVRAGAGQVRGAVEELYDVVSDVCVCVCGLWLFSSDGGTRDSDMMTRVSPYKYEEGTRMVSVWSM